MWWQRPDVVAILGSALVLGVTGAFVMRRTKVEFPAHRAPPGECARCAKPFATRTMALRQTESQVIGYNPWTRVRTELVKTVTVRLQLCVDCAHTEDLLDVARKTMLILTGIYVGVGCFLWVMEQPDPDPTGRVIAILIGAALSLITMLLLQTTPVTMGFVEGQPIRFSVRNPNYAKALVSAGGKT